MKICKLKVYGSTTVLEQFKVLELEPEPKLWSKSGPEPKINNFGNGTLKKSTGSVLKAKTYYLQVPVLLPGIIIRKAAEFEA